MPRNSKRANLLKVIEELICERWEMQTLRVVNRKYKPLEDCLDMELLLLYKLLLKTRYITRMPRRISSIAFDVFLADLEDNGDSSWLNNIEFCKKYRVSRQFFQTLLALVQDHDVFKKGGRGPEQSPVELQLMVFFEAHSSIS